ncbi:Wzz/FepE/Etk N-terminal domain-containing protein [Desulfogranum mediterraneum]|uniref:Wzz/FepE/Etk N-terminal domain-containing protein n=1 Tax=Desulfogranum mediterraneum TaxID=160661 RepID=UPI000427D578|nr:Wzz/FepE/Etk N-terminal domain-containing protein [Desulfogranum mediterraneum]
MNEKTKQLLKKYVDVLLLRKMLISCCVFLAVLGGLANYYRTPKTYKAEALLIYEEQKVNPSKMAPDMKDKIREVVNTLKQQVTSRTSLEKIIKEYDLYPGMRATLPLEDVIEAMRANILIATTRGDVFSVSYQGNDPRKVLRVTNALSSKFIEENLRYREERASETSSYIADELGQAKERLDRKEQAMRDYRLKYYNEMPHQVDVNVARLNTLQSSLQGLQSNIQELERTKMLLQEKASARSRQLASSFSEQTGPDGKGGVVQGGDPYQRLIQAKNYLRSLLARYKETHPEVKRVRKAIAALEAQLEGSGSGQDPEARPVGEDPMLLQSAIQRKGIELHLVELRKDEDRLRLQIKQLEQWVESAPVREAEWTALTRDYDEFKSHYDFLVAQNLQAVSVQNLERKQKGSQFKIMDPARLPEKPIRPDFARIMLLALGLGLGLGGGIALSLDMVDTSFKDPLDLEEYLGVSVTCSLPYLQLPREQRRSRWQSIGFVLFLLSGISVCCGAVFLLWQRGILIL